MTKYPAEIINDTIVIKTKSIRDKQGGLTIQCPPVNQLVEKANGKKIKLFIEEVQE